MARREGAVENVRVEQATSCKQMYVEGDVSDVVEVHLVETPYGAQEFVAQFFDEYACGFSKQQSQQPSGCKWRIFG